MQMVIESSARLRQEVYELLEEAAEALALAKTVGKAAALDLQRYAEQLKTDAARLQAKDTHAAAPRIKKARIEGRWSIHGLVWSIIVVAMIASLATGRATPSGNEQKAEKRRTRFALDSEPKQS